MGLKCAVFAIECDEGDVLLEKEARDNNSSHLKTSRDFLTYKCMFLFGFWGMLNWRNRTPRQCGTQYYTDSRMGSLCT